MRLKGVLTLRSITIWTITFIMTSGFGMVGNHTVLAKTLKASIIELEPYGFFTEDNQITGILYDYSKVIAEEAGFSCELELVPFARAIKHIETSEADFTIMFLNPGIEQAAITVASVRSYKVVIFGHPGTQYASLEDLHGKITANVREAKYDEAFDADEAITKYLTNDYQQSLAMFLKNRVDGVIGPEIGFLFTAKNMGQPHAIFGEPLVLSVRDGYLFFSRKNADEETISALRSAIERLKAQGTLEDIEKNYSFSEIYLHKAAGSGLSKAYLGVRCRRMRLRTLCKYIYEKLYTP